MNVSLVNVVRGLIWSSAGWSVLVFGFVLAKALILIDEIRAGRANYSPWLAVIALEILAAHGFALAVARPASMGAVPGPALLLCAAGFVWWFGAPLYYLLLPSAALLAIGSLLAAAFAAAAQKRAGCRALSCALWLATAGVMVNWYWRLSRRAAPVAHEGVRVRSAHKTLRR